MLQIGRSLFRSHLVSLEFFIDKILPIALWPKNEYQEYFLRVKSGRCVRLTTLSPSCAVVMKSGNLNFLEPSGPLQACNGTALLYDTINIVCVYVLACEEKVFCIRTRVEQGLKVTLELSSTVTGPSRRLVC